MRLRAYLMSGISPTSRQSRDQYPLAEDGSCGQSRALCLNLHLPAYLVDKVVSIA
jgi:hypothetical protein